MAKLLLLAACVASSMFLLTQLVTYCEFSATSVNTIDPTPSTSRNNQQEITVDLQNTVKSFLTICKQLNVTAVLSQQNLLEEFITQERSHRQLGQHNHYDCTILCRHRYVSFRMRGEQLQGIVDNFLALATEAGFNVVEDVDHDERDITIEKRKTRHVLLYHLYMERKNTMIHVVLTYWRHGREWTNVCNLELTRNSYFQGYLQKSPYCIQQQLMQPMQSTLATIDGLGMRVPDSIKTFNEMVDAGAFLPCYYANARKFVSAYGYDTSAESNEFRANAKQLLSIASRLLTRLGIRFWLSSGTCLGWFRQCDFIPHSKDVDIGIWITDYKKELIETFIVNGLKLKHRFGKVEDSFELSFTLNNLKLDIFFFYKETHTMWNGGTQAKTGRKFKYVFPKFSLCWATLSGLVVRVPCPAKPYIMANYGNNWNMLVKSWNWKVSPPNVRENGEWPLEERNEVIQVF